MRAVSVRVFKLLIGELGQVSTLTALLLKLYMAVGKKIFVCNTNANRKKNKVSCIGPCNMLHTRKSIVSVLIKKRIKNNKDVIDVYTYFCH